jgi:hypothetical protein
MDCHEAQLVMALYIIDHPSLTVEEREGFEAHLQVCPECAKDYKESSFAIKHCCAISDVINRPWESQIYNGYCKVIFYMERAPPLKVVTLYCLVYYKTNTFSDVL